MTKVKICGITNLEDALLSAKFGADALGFNFYEKSPRCIAPEKAGEIAEQLPERILKVGVFVNETLKKIIEIAQIAKLDALQLHGEETPEFARELKARTKLEIIKAFRVSPEFKPEDVTQYEVDAILLDAYSPKEHGGTGETFDWEIAKRVQEIFPKMYLAGGLSQDNIARAISVTRPFAVDVCSCLEDIKGTKDKVKLINFISIVTFARRVLTEKEDLVFLLRVFRSRPKMYFPQKSITQICIFIFGFLSALNMTKSDYEMSDKLLRDFEKYVGIQRGIFTHGIYSYAEYFLGKCDGDEEKAFDLFFALLEEFKLEKEDLGENWNVLKSTIMTTVEAIYENGIFKPVSSVPAGLKEHERVKVIIENETEDVRVSDVLLREMVAEGMISRIPEGISDEEDNFEPIEITGRPFSETLLEDRN